MDGTMHTLIGPSDVCFWRFRLHVHRLSLPVYMQVTNFLLHFQP